MAVPLSARLGLGRWDFGRNDWAGAELEKEGPESKISLPCSAVLTSLPVRFVGVASPPVQCSKTGLEKRDMKCWVVAMCARSYSLVPLFLCLQA